MMPKMYKKTTLMTNGFVILLIFFHEAKIF